MCKSQSRNASLLLLEHGLGTDISRHCSLTTENSASLTTTITFAVIIPIIINHQLSFNLWLSKTLKQKLMIGNRVEDEAFSIKVKYIFIQHSHVNIDILIMLYLSIVAMITKKTAQRIINWQAKELLSTWLIHQFINRSTNPWKY